MSERKIFSLLRICERIEEIFKEKSHASFWLKAEMAKINYYPQSGHCYPELVEKKDGKIVAQVKAIIWKDIYIKVQSLFKETLGEPLKDGMSILCEARISYTPVHGLSLIISNIDPQFILGELEKEKKNTILQLQKEGIYEQNKKLSFPLLPKRIAIISVNTSKGYFDFIKTIIHNTWNYSFYNELFSALLQGDQMVASIRQQLKIISKRKNDFDIVVIIRGGGGDIGLSAYNHIELCRDIALFPLPILTGVGHATNYTVSEMVAYHHAITPTDLAYYLIQKFHNFSVIVKECQQSIQRLSTNIIEQNKTNCQLVTNAFKNSCFNMLRQQQQIIQQISFNTVQLSNVFIQKQKKIIHQQNQSLYYQSHAIVQYKKQVFVQYQQQIKQYTIQQYKHQLANIELEKKILCEKTHLFLQRHQLLLHHVMQTIKILHPNEVLKRGYSISFINNKPLLSIEQINEGQVMTTQLLDGSIKSVIISSNTSI